VAANALHIHLCGFKQLGHKETVPHGHQDVLGLYHNAFLERIIWRSSFIHHFLDALNGGGGAGGDQVLVCVGFKQGHTVIYGGVLHDDLIHLLVDLQVVEEGAINALAGSSAVPWYIVGDKTTAKSVQVDYLNGMETPSFRRSEKAGYLGFVWDIWLDWGITVIGLPGHCPQ